MCSTFRHTLYVILYLSLRAVIVNGRPPKDDNVDQVGKQSDTAQHDCDWSAQLPVQIQPINAPVVLRWRLSC